MTELKLYIIDNGDWSVGIPSVTFEMEVPIYKEDLDKVMREEFRNDAIKLYQPYLDGRLHAIYSDETED